jgi:hypothetical protein
MNKRKIIACMGDPWSSAVKRFEAFARNTDPQHYSFVYVLMPVVWGPEPHYVDLDYTPDDLCFELVRYGDYDWDDPDLVMALNDKHWQRVLNHYDPTRPNLADKCVLNQCLRESGHDYLQTDNFDPEAWVFVKPRQGAGQYTTVDFAYRPVQYKQLASLNINPDQYTVQEYIDCPLVTNLTFVCNGHDLALADLTKAYHMTDRKGGNLNSHLESYWYDRHNHEDYIVRARDFIKDVGYNTVPGIYMTQYINDHRGTYLIDFNVRTGPVQDRMTVENFLISRYHRMIPFMCRDKTFDQCYFETPGWRAYLEDETGILSPRIKNPDYDNRILVSDNKTSGIIRNDYKTYIEKIQK